MTRAPVVAGFPVSHPTKNLMEVKCHEGKTVCKADLREVQDHPPQGQGYGYLPEPEAQAEAGMISIETTLSIEAADCESRPAGTILRRFV